MFITPVLGRQKQADLWGSLARNLSLLRDFWDPVSVDGT